VRGESVRAAPCLPVSAPRTDSDTDACLSRPAATLGTPAGRPLVCSVLERGHGGGLSGPDSLKCSEVRCSTKGSGTGPSRRLKSGGHCTLALG
jgi:hypothetical protein